MILWNVGSPPPRPPLHVCCTRIIANKGEVLSLKRCCRPVENASIRSSVSRTRKGFGSQSYENLLMMQSSASVTRVSASPSQAWCLLVQAICILVYNLLSARRLCCKGPWVLRFMELSIVDCVALRMLAFSRCRAVFLF
eukprot:scaffold312327_cov32-Tisochrysis_lutea.AAC.3